MIRLTIALALCAVMTYAVLGGSVPCGAELDQNTTLLKTFGVPPHTLHGVTDDEIVQRAPAAPGARQVRRISLARIVLWESVLSYRVSIDGGRASIPPEAGVWRLGRVVHPISGNLYDVVHWDDVDDGSATLYFEAGGTRLCYFGE